MKKTLIVVDVQNDFAVKDGALYVSKGEEVVPVVNRLMISGAFDNIVACQDFHSPGHKSFASNHKDKKVGEVVDVNGIKQILWPNHCVAGSKGSDFHKDLLTGKFDLIIRKGRNVETDSYSAFNDNAKHGTGLHGYLKSIGTEEVYVVGLATDYCVLYTVLDAIGGYFNTHLILDGCRAVNLKPEDGANAVEQMRKAGATVHKNGDELVKSMIAARG